MDTHWCTGLVYGVSPDRGTIESAEFEWDEINDPFLSRCLLHDLLEVGQVFHDQTPRSEDCVVKCPRVVSVTFGIFSPYRFDGCPVWAESVHAENPDPVLHEFCCDISGEIWVEEVGLGSRPRELGVPTRSDQEDFIPLTGLADFLLVFRQMLPFDPEPVSNTDERADVNDDRPTNQPLQRDLVNLLPVFVEVVRRVDVSARMGAEAESVNPAPVSSLEFEGGFSGELWVFWVCVGVRLEGVGQIYDFGHFFGVRGERLARRGPDKEVQSLYVSPPPQRDRLGPPTPRFSHLDLCTFRNISIDDKAQLTENWY